MTVEIFKPSFLLTFMERLFEISLEGNLTCPSDKTEVLSDARALEILSKKCHPYKTREDNAALVFVPDEGIKQILFNIIPRVQDGMCFKIGGSVLSNSQAMGVIRNNGHPYRREGSIVYMPGEEYETERKAGRVFR